MPSSLHLRQLPAVVSGRWLYAFSSLSNRDFRNLWFGMVFLSAGFSMELLAVGYLVYDLTSSAFLLGVVEMGFAVPTLALSLLGGVVADRFDRKYVIQAGQAAECAVSLAVAALILTDRIHWAHLAAMAMIEGSLFSFMMPARQAIIPQLVQRAQLTGAMAINAAAFSATTLLSPAAAGGLYALVGPGGVFLAIASLKAAAVLITARVRRAPPGRTGEPNPVFRDIKDGLAYVRRTYVVLALLVFTLVALLMSWPFHTLVAVFVKDVYNLGPAAMGLLLTAIGAGSLVGSLCVASIGARRRGQLLIAGAAATAAGLFLVAAIPVYYAAVAIMVLLGLGEGVWWAVVMALTMEHSEDRYRGRVSSIMMMTFGLMPLGVLPAGAAAQFIGPRITVAILAGLLAAAVLFFTATQKQVRSLQ